MKIQNKKATASYITGTLLLIVGTYIALMFKFENHANSIIGITIIVIGYIDFRYGNDLLEQQEINEHLRFNRSKDKAK